MRLIDLAVCAPAAVVVARTLRRTRPWQAPIRPKRPELHLEISDMMGGPRRTALHATTSIGSAPTASLRIRRVDVDRHHASIELQGTRWVLVDAGSTTGLWMNESPVFMPVELTEGDEVRVGQTVLRVAKVVGGGGGDGSPGRTTGGRSRSQGPG